MFRDNPDVYCDYQVIGPDGTSQRLIDFQLQQNYDGNPVGFGAGVKPPPTVDEFGSAPSLFVLREHVERVLKARHPKLPYVEVVQRIVGESTEFTVGTIREARLRVEQHVR
jgi:hypothetical protein